eukprot:gene15038-biopygen20158
MWHSQPTGGLTQGRRGTEGSFELASLCPDAMIPEWSSRWFNTFPPGVRQEAMTVRGSRDSAPERVRASGPDSRRESRSLLQIRMNA